MSETPCLIYDDPREIEAITYHTEEGGGWDTSYGECDRIVAYKEHGQCDWVPYFAVYRKGEIIARIPAHEVSVYYARSPA